MKKLFILTIFYTISLSGGVRTGLDMLKNENFKRLWNKNVAIVTNRTGVDSEGVSIVRLIHEHKRVNLIKIFTPEHGFTATAEGKISNGKYEKSKIPLISLYGKKRKPKKSDLSGVDLILFDIQDVGTRYYTYISTLAYVMQAAKESGLKLIVPDRPNPIGGTTVSGFVPPISHRGKFTSIYPIPTRHGMTIGEIALLFNSHFSINSDLEVIKMEGWRREMLYSDTRLLWINPSPNMKTVNGAILYSGLGWLETTNISMGRGTETPFEIFGAPFIDSGKVIKELQKFDLKDVSIIPETFTPKAKHHKYYGKNCHGVRIDLKNPKQFDAFEIGIAVITVLMKLYPEKYKISTDFGISIGSDTVLNLLKSDYSLKAIIEHDSDKLNSFMKIRAKYLLYP